MAKVEIGEVRLKGESSDKEKAKERVYSAEKRKKSANETLEEAWERILSSKGVQSSQAKLNRMKAVKEAMDAGEIGREPGAKGKFSAAEAERLYNVIKEQKREERLREMVDSLTDNYWLITDEDRLDEFLSILDEEEETVFDVETTGTDVWSDYIVGHVLTACKADIHAYIPTKHKTDSPQLDHEYVNGKLKPYYENPSLKKIAHHAKFDIHMLDREGIDLRGLAWDTQEAMRILNENEPSFQLKKLVERYLKLQSETYEELFGQVGFDEVSDLNVALAYAAKDGDITLKLRDFQRKHLAKYPKMLEYYEKIEVPIIDVVVEMEKTGYVIDLDLAKKYGEELTEQIEELSEKLDKELGVNEKGEPVNLNSPAQLRPALEKATGLTLESTDAKKVLKPLSSDYPVIKTLLDYKELVKLKSTYIDAIPEKVDPESGKIYANFNPNGAKTGRFSSGGGATNLQNQPYEARKMYVAPPGYVILGGDWSQQEYRCLAYYTQDPKLVENYQKGFDLYQAIASEVFEKPIEECGDGSIYRKQTKVILLAVAYGGGANMLKDAIGVSKQKAQQFLDSFFERFPGVMKWIKKNQAFVKKNGYVWMDHKQRKRRLPDARNYKANGYYSAVFTQSTNARIQGSSAIQTKATMIELQKLCERKTAEGRGEWRIYCVVHDEALLQVPETITEQDVSEFEDVMLNTYVFGNIPNKTDVELYKRWGDGISVEEWFNTKEDE